MKAVSIPQFKAFDCEISRFKLIDLSLKFMNLNSVC